MAAAGCAKTEKDIHVAMEHGRMVKVTLPSSEGGDDASVLYIVGAEDAKEVLPLVEDAVAIGSNIEHVGRVSLQLLEALGIKPGQVVRV
jgi:hypothetical protein